MEINKQLVKQLADLAKLDEKALLASGIIDDLKKISELVDRLARYDLTAIEETAPGEITVDDCRPDIAGNTLPLPEVFLNADETNRNDRFFLVPRIINH